MARPGKKEGLRYVEPHRGPDGKVRYYFRKGKGARIAMPPVPPGTDPKLDPAFIAAYAMLLNEVAGITAPDRIVPKLPGGARPVVMRVTTDSFAAALSRYYNSSIFRGLAEASQTSHRGPLNKFAKRYGAAPMSGLTSTTVQEAIKPLEPFAQQKLVAAMRRFVKWARATGELDASSPDPMQGLALHPIPKIKGHQPWEAKHYAKFERRWEIGTRERLAYEILKRLGLRRSDVRRLGPEHVVNGMLRFQPRKTRNTTAVWLDQPMDRELLRIIAATVTGAKTYLVDNRGKPFANSTFAAFMRRAYDRAGLPPECRNHGLRKGMMIDLVEAQAGVHEIMALSGHSTMKEIENYTKAFDRRRAALRAIEKRDARAAEQGVNAHSPNSPNSLGNGMKKPSKNKVIALRTSWS
jgi:integrase